MRVFYNSDYTASPKDFDTTRKSAHISSIVEKTDGMSIECPSTIIDKSLVDDIIRAIHDSEYVDALLSGKPNSLATSSGFTWGEKTYDFALAHSHGVVASIATVLAGEPRAGTLSSGLHHARPDSGSGFCTINGLAVGSAYALSEDARVMILDFDAHCGGGTFAHMMNLNTKKNPSIIQVDVSVSAFDEYDNFKPHYHDLATLDRKNPDISYLSHIEKALSYSDSVYRDDMVVIYNAGVDPVNSVGFDDPFSTIAMREKMVSEWVGDKPAIFTLAGGYTGGYSMDDIASLHMSTITEWVR